MKKIVFFIGSLEFGGAERVLSILASRLANQGYAVTILMYYNRSVCYLLDANVQVTSVEAECSSKQILRRMSWIRSYVKNNFDLGISFLAPFNMLFITATLGLKTPILVADRNDPRRVPNNSILRLARDVLYCFSNHVVAQTQANKAYFSKIVQNKTTVIPNPISPALIKGDALIQSKEQVLVTVGRLADAKNHAILIRAFSRVKQTHPTYQLHIYGDGSLKEALQEQIDALNMSDSIILKGTSNCIFDEIKTAQLFVLSSYYEGMPNALIEAMCLGLPVVSTKVSGAVDFIEDKENGLLVGNDQEQELVDAINLLLDDSTLRTKCAESASQLFDQLQEDVITDQWCFVIEQLG